MLVGLYMSRSYKPIDEKGVCLKLEWCYEYHVCQVLQKPFPQG